MRDLAPISSPSSLSFAAVAGQLATPSFSGQTFVSPGWLRFGGAMVVLKVAFVLLVAWLVDVIGFYDIGDLTHVLLLVGLTLLLLGFLRARDAAAAAAGVDKRSGKP